MIGACRFKLDYDTRTYGENLPCQARERNYECHCAHGHAGALTSRQHVRTSTLVQFRKTNAHTGFARLVPTLLNSSAQGEAVVAAAAAVLHREEAGEADDEEVEGADGHLGSEV